MALQDCGGKSKISAHTRPRACNQYKKNCHFDLMFVTSQLKVHMVVLHPVYFDCMVESYYFISIHQTPCSWISSVRDDETYVTGVILQFVL